MSSIWPSNHRKAARGKTPHGHGAAAGARGAVAVEGPHLWTANSPPRRAATGISLHPSPTPPASPHPRRGRASPGAASSAASSPPPGGWPASPGTGSTFIGSAGTASGAGRLGGVSSGRNATSVSRFSHVNPSLECPGGSPPSPPSPAASTCGRTRGRAPSRFSGVITRASSTMPVRQSLPSRSGSTTSGKRWMSLAATLRKCAAPMWREDWPAWTRFVSFMDSLSHGIFGRLQAHENALPGILVRGDLGPRPKRRAPLLNEMRPDQGHSVNCPSAPRATTFPTPRFT